MASRKWNRGGFPSGSQVISTTHAWHARAVDDKLLGASAIAQVTPDLTVAVGDFVYFGADGVTRRSYAGGNSPAFTAPSGNPKIGLLTIDDAGSLAWTYGAEAASPSAPNPPVAKVPICEVYGRVGMTAIKDDDDGSQGFIQRQASAIQAIQSPVAAQTFRNLMLRTHPDNDKALSQVLLHHADEIVMDIGESVPNWDALSAAITASGAGGLDTGAELASTWYEVYAIRKSSDGTKNLLLHRARDYFSDSGQGFTTSDDAQRALRLATSTATDRLAQGFKTPTAGAPGLIDFVDVKLVRVGAVVGNVWFTIEADSGGNPSGTPLATSDKMDASKISTTAQQIRVLFRNPVATAETSTQYHLVMYGDYTRSDTVFIAWRGVAAGGYANGAAKEYNGTTWAAASGVGDFRFKVYTRRNDTAVTMPAGYTQKAKIGYVYNDGSSNFRVFRGIDRAVLSEPVSSGNVTSAVPQLIDFSSALPPFACRVVLDGGSDVLNDVILTAGVPEGYDGSVPFTRSFAVASVTIATGAVPTGEVNTEAQALYVGRFSGTGNCLSRVRGYTW